MYTREQSFLLLGNGGEGAETHFEEGKIQNPLELAFCGTTAPTTRRFWLDWRARSAIQHLYTQEGHNLKDAADIAIGGPLDCTSELS